MNNKKEFLKQQHCIACNRYVKYSERYANYACAKCTAKAVDDNGQPIAFYNTTLDGHGCQGILTENNELTNSTTCLINGIKFKANEAYFGGIVLLPVVIKKRVSKKNST